MKFEVLKKDNLKRNIIIGVFVVLIISALILNFTRAKYRSTASIPIVNSEVNYVRPDLNIVALYIDGEQVSELDSSKKYTLDPNNSTCTYKDGSTIANLTLNYDSNTGSLSISPFTTRGTKCTLYFNEYIPTIKDTILSYYPTVLTRTDFSTNVTNTTTGTIYKSADSSQYDNDGEVYYFAGNPTDNWVYFAGFYWRIIRINGDNTIRLIYAGTSTSISGTDDQIGMSAFNENDETGVHTGFMYTAGEQHGTNVSSTIKEQLDIWYQRNLTAYEKYIDTNAGFCGDREVANGYNWSNTESFRYAAYDRIRTTKKPIFQCSNDNDLYTTTTSNKGNKALIYPIGLITADEVAFAGAVWLTTNEDYYLYTGERYWTITPVEFNFNNTEAHVFIEYTQGISSLRVIWSRGIRPVINLKTDVTISSGNGTASKPFTIE